MKPAPLIFAVVSSLTVGLIAGKQLTKESFSDGVGKENNFFIKFYAPW